MLSNEQAMHNVYIVQPDKNCYTMNCNTLRNKGKEVHGFMATNKDREGTKRIVLVMEEDLHQWLKGAAHHNWTSVAGFVRDTLEKERSMHPEWAEKPTAKK